MGEHGRIARLRTHRRLAAYALACAFVAWCALSLHGDLARIPLGALRHSWDLVGAAALLSLANYALRILRWRSYLARLGHGIPLRFAVLTYIAGFAWTLSPGKVGEMVRARYYRPLGVPLAHVTAAFFAERLMDVLAMVALAALLLASSAHYRGAILGVGLVLVALLPILAFAPWGRIASALEARMTVPPGFGHWSRALWRAPASAVHALACTRPLLRPAPLIGGLALAVCAWGLEGAGLGVLSSMVAPGHLPLATAIGVYGVAVLVGGLSFLPGGLGSTEAVMTTLLMAQGYDLGAAVLVTLVCRVVTLWLAVVLGWIAVLALRPRPLTLVES